MQEGDDFIWRAVFEGGLSYEALKNGTLDAFDIFIANEAIDTRTENQYRAQKAAEQKAKDRRR